MGSEVVGVKNRVVGLLAAGRSALLEGLTGLLGRCSTVVSYSASSRIGVVIFRKSGSIGEIPVVLPGDFSRRSVTSLLGRADEQVR